MKTFHLNCSKQIPEAKESLVLFKNTWISPSGDFYGFDGAKHEIAATWIAVFKLGANEQSLKHGEFFRDSWESFLLRNNWLCIKNLAWLGDDTSTFKNQNELTEKQKTRLFDYCQSFNIDYQKFIDKVR